MRSSFHPSLLYQDGRFVSGASIFVDDAATSRNMQTALCASTWLAKPSFPDSSTRTPIRFSG